MSKENAPAQQETIGVAMNRAELFFERNGRLMSYIFVALLVAAALVYGYRTVIMAPRAEKAAEMISQAQSKFEGQTPDFDLALNGDANGAGFLDVIQKYGSTSSGNLAKHYAGICYLQLGDLQNAAAYLSQFSKVDGLPGAVINAQNLGLQGDIAVELKDFAGAIKFYKKAVDIADNNMTAPMYLRKAGLAAQAAGDNAQAVGFYEQILANYPASFDAREAEKLLGSLK